ncbi:MAG: MurR/RpiR family transcriptional regulator [Synergistales bacterium]
MENKENGLLENLKKYSMDFSNKQRVLANYIIQNYKQVAFMNSRELSRKAKVSNSTVLRFAMTLGYPRFADFQDALQNLIRNQISTLDRYTPLESEDKNLLCRIASLEVNIINKMIENLNSKYFQDAIQLLTLKEKVLVLGYEGDAFAADYAASILQIIRRNVINLRSMNDAGLTSAIREGQTENAVALVYQFPRYYSKTTQFASLLKQKGVPIIGITDNVLSPLTHYADPLLFIPTKYNTFIDPHAAVMTLTHALGTGVIYSDKALARKNIQNYYEVTKFFKSCDLSNVEIIVGD